MLKIELIIDLVILTYRIIPIILFQGATVTIISFIPTLIIIIVIGNTIIVTTIIIPVFRFVRYYFRFKYLYMYDYEYNQKLFQ